MPARISLRLLPHLTLGALLLGCGSRTNILPSISATSSECPSGAAGLPVTLAAGLRTPTGIAIDDAYVYWAETGGSVRRVPICGGAITTLATDPRLIGQNIAVDATYVYWEDLANTAGPVASPSIMRVRKTGGTPESITANAAITADTPFVVSAAAVYCSAGDQLSLEAIPLDGAPARVLVPAAGALWGIAVDSAHVYWSDETPGAIIWESSLDSQGTGTPLAFAAPTTVPTALVSDGSAVYWTGAGANGASDGNVCRALIVGDSQVVLASGQANPNGLAVQRGTLFWTNMNDPSSGNVSSVPTNGGPITILAAGQNFPRAIAADDAYAYWTTGGNDDSATDGTIGRIAY